MRSQPGRKRAAARRSGTGRLIRLQHADYFALPPKQRTDGASDAFANC